MPPDPLVRARHLLSMLEHVDALPEPARQAIRGALEPAALAQIETSASTDWLPFSLDLDLTHALARSLGSAGTHRFFHDHQRASFQGPLLKTIVDAATALFGLDPGSWVRWVPRGWSTVFRECGRWEIDRTAPGEVDLALVAPPAGCLEDDVWLRSLASSFSSMLAIAKASGEFVLDHVDGARGAACYRLRWRTR
jgi:hypothetical protein